KERGLGLDDHGLQSGAQAAVRGHAAADGQTMQASPFQCLARLGHQDIHNGLLETGRHVRATLDARRRLRICQVLAADGIENGSLQAAETKIKTVLLYKGARKANGLRIAVRRRTLNGWTTGEAQTQNTCDLVERLARG